MRMLSVTALSAAMFTGTQALADGAQGQSRPNRHQMFAMMISCMRTRMSADHALSYNAAIKVCKDQRNNQIDGSLPANMVAETAAAKP
jgi:hypothetical protein